MSGIAERLAEALASADDGCWDYERCCHSSLEALLPVVEREIAAARGEAWEAGYDARGVDIANEGLIHTELTPNPHREPEPIDFGRMGYGICPRCHEDKFIGHGPLCWECFTGSRKEAGA